MLKKSLRMISPMAIIAIGFFATLGHSNNSSENDFSNAIDASLISIDSRTGKRVYQGASFTGDASTFHANGSLARLEQYKNGRRHGFTKHWFNNGTLAYEAYFQIGRRHGMSTSWWDNGNKRSETLYHNDHAEGVAWSWYSNGNKYKKYNYAAGQPIGLQQGWRLNGKLFSNFEYRNGRTYGLRNSNLCVELNDEEIAPSKLTNEAPDAKL